VQDDPSSALTLPVWYGEVPEATRSNAVPDKVGTAQVLYCDRGPSQLIVTFGHTDDIDHAELDWPAWTDRFARTKAWSHLSITTPKGSWFRDTDLITFLEDLRDRGFFKGFEAVTFFGPAPFGSGFAALAFAPLAPGATVLAFDAQSTLKKTTVKWDDRFTSPDAKSWSLPFSDAAKSIREAGKVYLAVDPLQRLDVRHAGRLKGKDILRLHGFGLYQDIGVALKRMGLMNEIFEQAVAGTLSRAAFHQKLRARKTLYLYRQVMERHLDDRKKPDLKKAFVAAFRANKRKQKAMDVREKQIPQGQKPAPEAPVAVTAQTQQSLPDFPKAPVLAGRRYPRTLGNVWGLQDDGHSFRYLSDQYNGTTMGFEERHGKTLAETHPLALGMAAFGHGTGHQRPLPEDFRFHVVDETLTGNRGAFQATTQAAAVLRMAAARRHAYRTIVALSEHQAGITPDEAMPGSSGYSRLMDRIAAARLALQGWNKAFHLDRISLRLLAGAPQSSFQDALRHYGAVAKSIRHDAAVAAGQSSFPHIIVSQSAGTAKDGTSEVILAEGQLDTAHPALGILVATPTYPYARMQDMPATLEPAAQMRVDELEALAVAARQENQPWFCPSLRQAYGRETLVLVEFAALSPLVLETGFHGIDIVGASNSPQITNVAITGTTVRLTLDKVPEGRDVFITYAWGAQRDAATDGKHANQGALRDSWSHPSLLQPGETLHRYALSGRVRLMPSDLPIKATGKPS
jgi:hypothetical protein